MDISVENSVFFDVTSFKSLNFPVKITVGSKGQMGIVYTEEMIGYQQFEKRKGITEIKFTFDVEGHMYIELIPSAYIPIENADSLVRRVDKNSASERKVPESQENKKLSKQKQAIDPIRNTYTISPIYSEREEDSPNKENIIPTKKRKIDREFVPAASTSDVSNRKVTSRKKFEKNMEMDIDGLEKVEQNELNVFREKKERIMFVPVTLAEIEMVNENFFRNSDKVMKFKISKMVHAKRYWLALKFYLLCSKGEIDSKINVSINDIDRIFGFRRQSLKKYVHKNGMSTLAEMIEKCNNLSPTECEWKRQKAYITKYASNYEQLVKKGRIKYD